MKFLPATLTVSLLLVACHSNRQSVDLVREEADFAQDRNSNDVAMLARQLQVGMSSDETRTILEEIQAAAEKVLEPRLLRPFTHVATESIDGVPHQLVRIELCTRGWYWFEFVNDKLSHAFVESSAYETSYANESRDKDKEELPMFFLPAREEIAMSEFAQSVETRLREATKRHQRDNEFLEPSPILLLFPKQDSSVQHALSIKLIQQYDASQIQLGSTSVAIRDRLGAPIVEYETRDGTIMVFGQTAKTGWYPTPFVLVESAGGRVVAIRTVTLHEYGDGQQTWLRRLAREKPELPEVIHVKD